MPTVVLAIEVNYLGLLYIKIILKLNGMLHIGAIVAAVNLRAQRMNRGAFA